MNKEVDDTGNEQVCPNQNSLKEDEINIGKIVEDYFQKSGFSVVEFAKRIHTTRENVYNIFRRKSMDCELLQKISETLNHDFFKYYQQNKQEHTITEDYKKLIQKNNLLLKRLLTLIEQNPLSKEEENN